MFEAPPGGHELHDHAPDLIPMNEDERAFEQWRQHQLQNNVAQLPMPPHAGAAVHVLPAAVPAAADVAASVIKALPAAASAVPLEKVQRLIPVGKPVLLIREVSHQQLLDMVNSSQRVLEQSVSWEHLVNRLTWVLFVASVVILVALAVSFVWKRDRLRETTPLRRLRH